MSDGISSGSTLIYLTDTHTGGKPEGWHQQPRHDALLEPIMASVGQIARQNGAELIIHGGDLTENSAPAEMKRALDALQSTGLPTAFCLGNHDVMDPAALARWRDSTGASAMADATIRLKHADVFILNNIWRVDGRADWFWAPRRGENPQEGLLGEQLEQLDQSLAGPADRPAVVVVHAPLEALPPALTGADKPLHPVQPDYAQSLNAVLDRHRRVRLVLAGHNHVTSAALHAQPRRVHLSTSAITESPFEFRLVRITPRSVHVQTLAAIPMTDQTPRDLQKIWVNGRPEDRTIELTWN